jgi:hypothetical protein
LLILRKKKCRTLFSQLHLLSFVVKVLRKHVIKLEYIRLENNYLKNNTGMYVFS